jgi:hypothetical protein
MFPTMMRLIIDETVDEVQCEQHLQKLTCDGSQITEVCIQGKHKDFHTALIDAMAKGKTKVNKLEFVLETKDDRPYSRECVADLLLKSSSTVQVLDISDLFCHETICYLLSSFCHSCHFERKDFHPNFYIKCREVQVRRTLQSWSLFL